MNSMREYRDSEAEPRFGCFRLPAMSRVYHNLSSEGIITQICMSVLAYEHAFDRGLGPAR